MSCCMHTPFALSIFFFVKMFRNNLLKSLWKSSLYKQCIDTVIHPAGQHYHTSQAGCWRAIEQGNDWHSWTPRAKQRDVTHFHSSHQATACIRLGSSICSSRTCSCTCVYTAEAWGHTRSSLQTEKQRGRLEHPRARGGGRAGLRIRLKPQVKSERSILSNLWGGVCGKKVKPQATVSGQAHLSVSLHRTQTCSLASNTLSLVLGFDTDTQKGNVFLLTTLQRSTMYSFPDFEYLKMF